MYTAKQSESLKHLDFLFFDLMTTELSFFAASGIRNGFRHLINSNVYMSVAVVLALLYVCVAFFIENYDGILRRGRLVELKKVFFQIMITLPLEVSFIFLSGYGRIFSRAAFLFHAALALPLLWTVRTVLKQYKQTHSIASTRSMVILTSSDIASEVIRNIAEYSCGEYKIIGLTLMDTDERVGDTISGCPVVCKVREIYSYLQTIYVDAVFANVSVQYSIPDRFFNTCAEMGITTHLNLAGIDQFTRNLVIERIGSYVVLTKAVKVASFRQIVLKRMLDILGGIVGCILTLLLAIIVGPVIYLTSPGPIFFTQIRVGKNGKPFKMYKFRSMVMDAEQLKKELLAHNKMNGLMFKMDADPRILGSGPDGKRHGIGWFIRRTSIDEFPQFFNVLANHAPSACNRQPVKVYITNELSMVDKVSSLIPGNIGFEDEVPNWVIVTVDRRMFGTNEVLQWYVNGGIYLSYLVEAMHAYHIGSCIFQIPLTHPNSQKLYKLISIPKNEAIIAGVGFGYAKSKNKFLSATRRPVDEVCNKF